MPATRPERLETGKALRKSTPRGSHATWQPAPDRPDPVALLHAQDEGRLKKLLPIKYGRMLESPFAFLRGSAVLMAADLANTPAAGIDVLLCGDSHLSNFGVFATPERQLVFDLNDFDDVYPGPWEWDLKRLAASAVVAGRDNGFSEKVCRRLVKVIVVAYGKAMARFSEMDTLEQWYYHVDGDRLLDVFQKSSKRAKKHAREMLEEARSNTHQQTLEKLTQRQNGHRRIVSAPPLLVPFHDSAFQKILAEDSFARITSDSIRHGWRGYLDSLPDEQRFLLKRYEIVDFALRVGGIGSVGTRCLVVLLKGGAEDDHLLLQLKQASPSVLASYLEPQPYQSQARRIVTGQRLIQAHSDIFLGWHRSPLQGHEYYWRQLKDMKGAANITEMDAQGLETYLAVCAGCLARAHARTGDEVKIFGYLGCKGVFAKSLADFALAYADQVEADYQLLVAAVRSGRIDAQVGI